MRKIMTLLTVFVLMCVSILSLVVGSFANRVTRDRAEAGFYTSQGDLYL